jgi:hypothetical protein
MHGLIEIDYEVSENWHQTSKELSLPTPAINQSVNDCKYSPFSNSLYITNYQQKVLLIMYQLVSLFHW